MSEKTEIAATAKAPQKFPLEKLAAGCMKLFGVTTSTFAGATLGMTGDYTVAEVQERINKWLRKEVKP